MIIPEMGCFIVFPIQVVLIPLMLIMVMLGADWRGVFIVWLIINICAASSMYLMLRDWAKNG